jgi:euchromatic histone-lysine N-methyltransferase
MVEQCVSNGPKRKEVAKNGKKEKQKTEETETQRRTSDRIKSKQREEKERLVRKRVQILDEQEEKGNLRKRSNANVTEEEEVVMAEKLLNQVLGSTEKQKEVTLSDAGGVGNVVTEKSATVKVKDTLRLFNKFYLQLVQVFFSLKPLWVEWFHDGLLVSPDFCCVLSVMACFCVIL